MDVNAEAGLFSITTQRGMTGNRVAALWIRVFVAHDSSSVHVVAATFHNRHGWFTLPVDRLNSRHFTPVLSSFFILPNPKSHHVSDIKLWRWKIVETRRDWCSDDIGRTCRCTVKRCVLTFFGRSLWIEGHSSEKRSNARVSFQYLGVCTCVT